MITAHTMIQSAMRKMQVLGVDRSPTALEAADGLYALNAMLDLWSIERLMVYQIQQTTHSWASGVASRTIGNGGDFNTGRPIKFEDGSFFRSSENLDYPVMVLPRQDFDSLADKTSSGSFPDYLFYDDAFPARTLYAWPILGENATLHLNSWKALQQFTSLTSELSLPPGYQVAIETNLAVYWAPEFGKAAADAVQNNGTARIAVTSKNAIKAVNQPNLVAEVDFGHGHRANIYADQ